MHKEYEHKKEIISVFPLLAVCVCRLLADADGIEVLAQLLTDSMAECRQFAADSITSMAPDGKFFYVYF